MNCRIVWTIGAMMLLAVSATATTSSFETKVREKIQDQLDYFADYFNTSYEVGIATSNDTKFNVVSGSDDHEGGKIHENTLIPLGSATKFYTSVYVLQLAQRGLVDLDDPAHQVIDPFLQRTNGTNLLQLWNNDVTINTVTIRHLLGMRACLSDYDDGALQKYALDPANRDVTITPYDFLHQWAPKNFICTPGKGGAYSSIGYVLLGFVIAGAENVTEWTDVDQRQILPKEFEQNVPGLTFPLLGKCADYKNVSHQFAAMFNSNEAPGYWTTISWEDIYDFSCLNGWTMGNIASTADDTASTMYHVFGADASPSLLSSASVQAMTDFKPLTVGWSVGLEYGLGLMQVDLFPNKGAPSEYTTFVGHAGQDYGSAASMHYYSEKTDIAITIASNTEYGMNCSLSNLGENFQEANYVSCKVWSAVLEVATDDAIKLQCDASSNKRLTNFRRLGDADTTSGAGLPLHCATGKTCVGASSNLDADECFAWKEFHTAANGVSWHRCADKWDDPCGCSSVACSEDGHITSIDLSLMGIAASIPSVVSSFSKLETLNLSYNYFFGPVPNSIAELNSLTSLNLESNALSDKLPELPFSQFVETCSLDKNDFDCPLPTGSDACKAACDSGPNVTSACGESFAAIYANADVTAATSALGNAIGTSLATEGQQCGTQLAKNKTCHMDVDLSSDSIKSYVSTLVNAAQKVDKTSQFCPVDIDKVQYCDNVGTCELFIKNVSVFMIPEACTKADLANFLTWNGRFSKCIESDYGTKCLYSWADGEYCGALL
eukprot:g1938.t1